MRAFERNHECEQGDRACSSLSQPVYRRVGRCLARSRGTLQREDVSHERHVSTPATMMEGGGDQSSEVARPSITARSFLVESRSCMRALRSAASVASSDARENG